MKILQIIQKPQLRGAEIFACQLSIELKMIGDTVDVAYLFSNESNQLNFDLNFISLHGSAKKRFLDWRAYKKLNEVIILGNYDIVQANAGDTLKYAVFSKKIFGWKQPLVFRNANTLGAFIKNKIHKRFNQALLSSCDYFISVSESCRRDLISIYSPAEQRSETIPIGTYEFEKIVPSEFRHSSEPVLINVASFVPEKNHSFLLDIFHLFFQKNKSGYLWLVGDGKLRPALEAKARALALEERIIFFGFTKNVLQLLKAADVMVMPSKIEGLPAVILEALAMGVPVVASSVGGIPDVITDESTGFCISSEESERYVEKIERILKDEELRKKIIGNGKAIISSNFAMSSIGKKFKSAYTNLLRQE